MDTVIHFDTQLLNFLAGAIIPLLVAIFAKLNASSRVKAALAVVLTALSAFITVGLGEPEGGVPLYDYLFSAVQTFIASGVLYSHLYKPLNVTPTLQAKTADFGVGGNDLP